MNPPIGQWVWRRIWADKKVRNPSHRTMWTKDSGFFELNDGSLMFKRGGKVRIYNPYLAPQAKRIRETQAKR